MSSQQTQIHPKSQHLFLPLDSQRLQHGNDDKLFSQRSQNDPSQQPPSTQKFKFDIKKFEQNILRQILSKHQQQQLSNRKKNESSSKKQPLDKSSLSHINSFKQISNQRKLSRSKSKSKKDLQFKKTKLDERQIHCRTHLTNTKILRQKLLTSLQHFNDYQMINIEDSIPILNHAHILKILTSLSQTKAKIQEKNLPEGRVKQEAKFIYFLWKMINEEFITTRHLKEIVILLNQMGRSELVDALGELYCRNDAGSEVVRMFVDCWMKLKVDKYCYLDGVDKGKDGRRQAKDNILNHKTLSSSKKPLQKPIVDQPTVKKHERCKTQYIDAFNTGENLQNDQQFKEIKFLHPQEEKKLVERLYEDRKDFLNHRERVKTLNDEQKQNRQVKKCTFKPLLTSSSHHRSTSRSNLMMKSKGTLNMEQLRKQSIQKQLEKNYESKERSSSRVKGFQKAVKRLKNGHSQTKLKQQQLAYHSVGQNYEKIKQKPMNPPKFLERQKEKKQELILFVIEFQIGRHKVKIKIHPTDTEMSVSKKISKIYGLKPEQEDEIRSIVSMELNNYYKKISEDVSQFIDS